MLFGPGLNNNLPLLTSFVTSDVDITGGWKLDELHILSLMIGFLKYRQVYKQFQGKLQTYHRSQVH